jgi:hypothetical protein
MAVNPQIEELRNEINARAAPDKYLDEDEERGLFSKERPVNLDRDTIEGLINQMCRDNNWTREKEIVSDLNDLLEGTTRDDGAIDKKEFDHCVNFAVSLNMPRRRAIELSARFVKQNKLVIKKSGWMRSVNWFEELLAGQR